MTIRALWRERPLLSGRWTLKDIVQGKPIGHPSHPMFVHFPSALFPTALGLDIISRIHSDITLTRAAFYDITVALIVGAFAAATGLVDYLPMIGGSRKKRVGTYHLICQVTAMSAFALSLLLRAFDFDATRTPVAALALALVGTGAIVTGNYFGGTLVYRQGMRVNTGDDGPDLLPTPPAGS
ncbi:MAG: DUF2231 domain-containing protein [Dehalococcoidia bacterium]